MVPVAILSVGESADIVRLGRGGPGEDTAALGRASDMGLRSGQRVRVLSNTGDGPVLVKVKGSRIAIGRALAHQVFVSIAEGD